VNLKTIPGLDQASRDSDGLHIGALTTLSRLAAHPLLSGSGELSVLREALESTASPQLRHMATVGGNLLQLPRCWYFRNKLTHCWLKGGRRCYAVRGENKYHAILGRGACQAVHASDPAVALVALEATVTLSGPEGTRTVPLTEAFRQPQADWRSQSDLGQNELLVDVFVPAQATGSWGTYIKVSDRTSWDFALVSLAVQLVAVSVRRPGVAQRRRANCLGSTCQAT
jgi:xanthine dehydrogenase YagS FAD-binding subunit